jgi:hypothetical protein
MPTRCAVVIGRACTTTVLACPIAVVAAETQALNSASARQGNNQRTS